MNGVYVGRADGVYAYEGRRDIEGDLRHFNPTIVESLVVGVQGRDLTFWANMSEFMASLKTAQTLFARGIRVEHFPEGHAFYMYDGAGRLDGELLDLVGRAFPGSFGDSIED